MSRPSSNSESTVAATSSQQRCRVCRSDDIAVQRLSREARGRRKTFSFHVCGSCGFISNPNNRKKSEDAERSFAMGSRPHESRRAGDGVRGGREFYMLETAIEILGRSDLEVLFFGSGLSRDHELAATLPTVKSTHVTDLRNYQETSHFVLLDSERRFDVVICCEVVEHFPRPRREFQRLLGFAKDDGIVVCSTNLNDGSPLESVDYPWSRGHVSYFSGASLLEIARQNRVSCDFRLPECALRDPGPRKRYVFFFRGRSIQDRIQETFARIPFALSEEATDRHRRSEQAAAPAMGDVVAVTKAWAKHTYRWRWKRLQRYLGRDRKR